MLAGVTTLSVGSLYTVFYLSNLRKGYRLGSACLFVGNTPFFQAVSKLWPADAQQPGGASEVASGALHGFLQQLGFKGVQVKSLVQQARDSGV